MRPADNGGYTQEVGDLILCDTSKPAYLKGLWEGYQTALSTLRGNCAQAVPNANDWKGSRADAFRTWCDKAGADLTTVNTAIGTVVEALGDFIMYCGWVNSTMASAADLVKQNTTQYYALNDNSITGTWQFQGNDQILTIKGATMSPVYLDETQWPTWLQSVQQLLFDAERDFETYSGWCNDTLSSAMTQFGALQQFKHWSRSSASGSQVFGDPTWNELTGGNVIRPSASGFTSNPFGTDDMPEWYDPTTGQKISNWIGDHEWVVDLGAIFLACIGQPEAGTVIEVLVHGTKLTIDAADGDLSKIPWDTADVVLDFAGADKLAEDIVDQMVYHPRHLAGDAEPLSPAVAGKVTAFVQARLREALEESVTGEGGEGKVPASTISEIAAEAQAKAETLMEAGVAA